MAVNTETSSIKKDLTDANQDGSCFGQSAADKIAFYGGTPATQPTSANQAAVSTTAITAVATTPSTTTTPYGFTTSAQADAIVASLNAVITRQASNYTLSNAIRSALVTLGLIKGS